MQESLLQDEEKFPRETDLDFDKKSGRKRALEITVDIKKAFVGIKDSMEVYQSDMDVAFTASQVCNNYNLQISTKFAITNILVYQTMVTLGTDIHRASVERMVSSEEIGCFALTELGHGSNIKGLQTTATYD